MIIWGSRGRTIEQGRGEFHCPRCDGASQFKQMRVATYFTLYFIPLFETTHHGDYIECLECGGQFETAVLNFAPPTDMQRILQAIQADLDSGTPVQMVRTKLTNAGLQLNQVNQLVDAVAPGGLRTCASCNLQFMNTIEKCSVCSASLTTSTAIRAS